MMMPLLTGTNTHYLTTISSTYTATLVGRKVQSAGNAVERGKQNGSISMMYARSVKV